ncbi:MAG: dehypoxanthine futalosine cyclase [Proteobacteria bacterium]|nr:dehypoxanthine futalosine cyclase [Pseudomonadota bacterium]
MKEISEKKAFFLLTEEEFLKLGKTAEEIRFLINPEKIVTYVIDRNINYTNICESGCKFCAFYRNEGDEEAYLLDHSEILKKVDELASAGGTQLLIQGGLHPNISISYLEDLFRKIKNKFPSIIIHSLSPAEIIHISKKSELSVEDTLIRLKEAGLESLPGGGAEILVNEIRSKISPKKIGWKEWQEVMYCAHKLGMKGTATMMFGSVEKPQDIITHLKRVREFQEETGFFRAFIPWTYQPGKNELGGVKASSYYYLRVLAVSRIYLHNIRNIQASWVTQGPKVSQLALFFGANDMGGTMMEENVVSATGWRFLMDRNEIVELIKEAGFEPKVRNTRYEVLE